MKTIYRARGTDGDGNDQWWVSLNGEGWLNISREPRADDFATIGGLFVHTYEKDGRTHRMTRMTFAKRYVLAKRTDHWGGGALELEPLIFD